MQLRLRRLLTVLFSGIYLVVTAVSGLAAEGRAVLVCTPEKCVSSWAKASDGGLVANIIGAFQVDYKEYTISGSRGQFSQPPQDKTKATTRLRAVVTESPRLSQSGPDSFEMTAGKQIDIDLEDESITATGGVRITTKETVITAGQLVGGPLAHMQSVIEQAVAELDRDFATLVQLWLAETNAEDRLMLIEGEVKASDPSFTFNGQRLVANISTESYLFIGPHVMELNITEEEGSD